MSTHSVSTLQVCEVVLVLCVLLNVGKKLLGRSQVRSVAEKRKDKINEYCKVCQH